MPIVESPTHLVATDLDGTLLRSDGTPSGRSLAAIGALAEQGIEFVIATGRPPRWIRPIAELLGHAAHVIGANGAILYDPFEDRVLDALTFPGSLALDIVTAVRASYPEVRCALETTSGMAVEEDYEGIWPLPADARRGPLDRLCAGGDVIKVLVRHLGGSRPVAFGEDVRDMVGEAAAVTWSMDRSGSLVEIMAPGVDKEHALARWCERLSVERTDVMAFGDMPNDVGMVRWAGWGVAVANAHPEVIAVADEVTATNDEDGVARVIERIVSEGPH